MPTGGVRTSLAGMVSQMTAALRRRGGATSGKGAPIASYPDNTSGAPQVFGQSDLTQFAPVFQPSGGFFAPGYPLVPPEPERLRLYDFPSGYNYIYTPRSFEPIGFPELRALAQNHDITRLAIETRKDQIEALEWSIKPIDEKNPKPGSDARAEKMTAFWKKPDGITPFATWLRELLEDLLVLDAPTLECRTNRAGEIIGLELVDGATIKVLIDDTGRRPRPPAPGYEQIIHGRPWVLTEDGRVSTELRGTPIFDNQLIYLPRNPRTHKPYGMSPVEQIIMTVNIGLRRQIMQLQHFTAGNVPAGMATSPDGWIPDQVAQYQEWFDSMLAGNTANRTKIIWGPNGAKYQPFKEAPYKDDFDEWLARIVCYAFSLPPTAFVRQVNRATAGTAQETAIEEGLSPIMGWVKRLVDTVMQDRMGQPDLQFSWLDVRPVDPKDQADILTEYAKNGVYTLNEARDILGMDPVEGGDLPMIITASGATLLKNIEALGEQQLNPPMPPQLPPRPGEEGGGGPPGSEPAPVSPPGAGKPPANGKKKPPAEDEDKPPAKAKKAAEVAKAGNSPFGGSGPPPYLVHARLHIRATFADFLRAEAPRAAREALAASKHSLRAESCVRYALAHPSPISALPYPGLAKAVLAKAGISKDQADYTDDGPVEDERCRHCTMFRAPDSCTLVEGDIHPGGHCRFFEAEDDDDQPPPKKDHDEAALALLVAAALGNISFDRWTGLSPEIEPDLIGVVRGTIADTLAGLGVTPTAAQQAEINKWAADWAAKRAEKLITLLTGSTPDMASGAVEEAIREGLTIGELAERLTQTGAFSDSRAERIADYETINAYHQATLEGFKIGGVGTVIWVTMDDDLVEEVCEGNADDGPIAVGETFSSGDDAPPAHPNCRCWLEPGDTGEQEGEAADAS
jgi:HK97 family phage portal protein